jgi:hypothetical protein
MIDHYTQEYTDLGLPDYGSSVRSIVSLRPGSLLLGSEPRLIEAFRAVSVHLQSGHRTDNLCAHYATLADALDQAAQTQEGIRYLEHRAMLKQRMTLPIGKQGL